MRSEEGMGAEGSLSGRASSTCDMDGAWSFGDHSERRARLWDTVKEVRQVMRWERLAEGVTGLYFEGSQE